MNNYLDFFEFNTEPFTNTEQPFYRFKSYRQKFSILKILNFIKGKNGVALVQGSEGVGKTFIINQLKDVIFNQKVFLFDCDTSESLEKKLLSFFKVKTELRGKRIVELLNEKGLISNCVFIVDDFEDITVAEKEIFEALAEVCKLEGNNCMVLFSRTFPDGNWKNLISMKSHLYPLNLLRSMSYMHQMIKSSYGNIEKQNPFSISDMLLISFISNGKFKFLNQISKGVLQDAANKKKNISLRNMFNFFRENKYLFRAMIAEKLKQLFLIITAIFILFMGYDIINDRIENKIRYKTAREIQSDFDRELGVDENMSNNEKQDNTENTK